MCVGEHNVGVCGYVSFLWLHSADVFRSQRAWVITSIVCLYVCVFVHVCVIGVAGRQKALWWDAVWHWKRKDVQQILKEVNWLKRLEINLYCLSTDVSVIKQICLKVGNLCPDCVLLISQRSIWWVSAKCLLLKLNVHTERTVLSRCGRQPDLFCFAEN